MKGVFNPDPLTPKYHVIWNLEKVLIFFNNISENSQLSLKNITLKFITLIAFMIKQRIQTISSFQESILF